MKTVVFDFDKTLTYSDSLYELFMSHMRGVKSVLKLYYLGLKVLAKLDVITIAQEKTSMIKLLFGGDEERFSKACREQQVKLAPTMQLLDKHVEDGDRVIVLSASAVYLLKEVFKKRNVEILGSEFVVKDGMIKGFKQHPFWNEKLEVITRYGITEIDDEYFDSHYDECLKSISKHWHRVKDGVIVEEK